MEESAFGIIEGENFFDSFLEKWESDITFKENTVKKFKNDLGKDLTREEIMDAIKSIKEIIIEIEDSHNFLLIGGTKLALLCFEEMLKKMNNERHDQMAKQIVGSHDLKRKTKAKHHKRREYEIPCAN